MERMKHTGDYELDTINMLEQECSDLEEENNSLEEENKKLKEYNGELIENHKKDIAILCEENKKLKENIKFLHEGEGMSCLERIEDLEKENKRLRKTVVMQEMEYNQLLKSYNRLAKELEEAKANRSPFTIFKK